MRTACVVLCLSFIGESVLLAAPREDVEKTFRAPTLERAAYVRAVLASNPSLESAQHSLRAARARVDQAGTFEDPMVDVGVAPLSIGSSKMFGYEVGISQELPWFGKRALESAMASAEVSAKKNDLESMRRDLALTAVTLYDQYYVTARSLELNEEHRSLLGTLRRGALAAFEAGRASAQDPLQADSELASVEKDAAVLEGQRTVLVAQMNELARRLPDAALPPPPKALAPPPGPDMSSAKRLSEEAVRARSEIRAVESRAHAERAREQSASRAAWPDVTVSTSYNSMWDTPEHRWMVGLGFNLPIQAGKRRGMAGEALASRAELESEARRLAAATRTQVYVALAGLKESRQVLELYSSRMIPLAKDRIDAAQAGFIASQNPFMAVIEAERNLRDAELDYEMAKAEADRRNAELERALGRIPGLGEGGAP